MTAPVVPRKEVMELLCAIVPMIRTSDNGRLVAFTDEIAQIVELALRAAESSERERCAKRCERYAEALLADNFPDGDAITCAASIRAMGQKEMGDGSPDVASRESVYIPTLLPPAKAPDGAVSRCDGSGRVPAGSLQHAEWRCPGCPACRKEKP